MTPLLDFEKIVKALERQRVRHLLVGGWAAISHGMNYSTDDFDICYDRKHDNLTALVRAFEPAHPKLRVPGGTLDFLFDEKTLKNGLNFTLQTDWGPIDLLGELQGVGGYKDLLPRASKHEFYGVKVYAISLDDLIKAKQIAGRVKDKLHLMELEAIREIKRKKGET